ncbi:GTP-binding protein [Trichinella spiralis]|uniref:GTP-binding protein n=3 Tax=Trichinella spiralis TaxID=6334 RepID=A0A0V1BAW5_TRISP|nr:GTP-binding protein [Trichinella spiralis]
MTMFSNFALKKKLSRLLSTMLPCCLLYLSYIVTLFCSCLFNQLWLDSILICSDHHGASSFILKELSILLTTLDEVISMISHPTLSIMYNECTLFSYSFFIFIMNQKAEDTDKITAKKQPDKGEIAPLSHGSILKKVDKIQPNLWGRQNVKFKVILLGASQVGKTAIVDQYLWKKFQPDNYKPTIDEFNWIEYETENGNTLMLELIDTAGCRDFPAMRNLYMTIGDAFILVYSVDNQASFEEIKQIRKEIATINHKNAPVILVGNKIDLLHDGIIPERAVVGGEVEQYAKEANCSCVDASAGDFDSVERIFETLFQNALSSHEEYQKLRKRRQSMPLPTTSSNFVQRAERSSSTTTACQLQKRKSGQCLLQ